RESSRLDHHRQYLPDEDVVPPHERPAGQEDVENEVRERVRDEGHGGQPRALTRVGDGDDGELDEERDAEGREGARHVRWRARRRRAISAASPVAATRKSTARTVPRSRSLSTIPQPHPGQTNHLAMLAPVPQGGFMLVAMGTGLLGSRAQLESAA